MSIILDRCRTAGNVVFDANYSTGSIADKSPYAAAATVTAPVTWVNTKLGYGVRMTGAGRISYADNAANRLAGSSATWIMFGNFQRQVALSRVLSKRDGVKIDWELALASATTISLYDWTNVSVMTGSVIGKRLAVVTLVSGAKPKLYLDGTFASEGTLTCTIPTNVTPPAISVSNFYTGAYPSDNVLNRTTLLNRALSAPEVSQLYQELMAERYPLRAYSFASRTDVALAKRSTFKLDMQRVPVSLANMVGPCEVPNTPFRLQAGGTWKVSEDAAGKRWFESVAGTAGVSIYAPSAQAYGTFVFDIYHTAASEWVLIISNLYAIADTARTAYSIYLDSTTLTFFQLKPALANTVLCVATNAIAVGNKYTVAITRSSSGEFTLYLKTSAQWAKVVATSGTNPVTNADYTTSSYFVCANTTAASAGKFSNPRFFQDELSLGQLQEMCP